ncbi:MAG: DUF3084 domain-containing protein [Candidatus Margulisbacteria bacterium]|jgi:uncharacterized protein (DUF3084 family)|nr:DUF3084 domain-containing protein [Candidatus Margulisiibacteriota bacterium]
MISSFTLRILLLLIVISGAIAYIGNRVGKYIGKRRLTLFGLRPRYTAIMITVVSGILIALGTVGAMLALSANARTALLGLDRLQQEIDRRTVELGAANKLLAETQRQQQQLGEQLSASQKEAAQLQKAKQQLSAEIRNAREGELIFKKGEIISLSLIQSGPDKGKINEGLRRIINNADDSLRSLGIRTARPLVNVGDEEFNETAYTLLGESRTFVVKLVSDNNVLWGEPVPAVFELLENKLIYRAGAEIVSGEVAGSLTQPQAEQAVMKLLKSSHQAAREAGIIPDPAGSIGSIPFAQISDTARRLRTQGRKAALRIVAQSDTYTIGPLAVDLRVNSR